MRLGLGLGLSRQHTAGGTSVQYLAGEIDGVVAQYSGINEDSADGTGNTFKNLISSPADGSSQSDWDLDAIALSTLKPEWSSDKSRWVANHDGAFSYNNQSGPTALLNSHRNTNGNPFTFIYYGTNFEGENGGILGGPQLNAGFNGVNITFNAVGSNYHIQFNDGGSNNVVNVVSNYEIGLPFFLIVTWDPTETTNNLKIWANSSTPSTYSFTFDTDAAWNANAGIWQFTNSSGNSTGTVNQYAELQEIAMTNTFVTQSDVDSIISYYKTLTGDTIDLAATGSASDVTLLYVNLVLTASSPGSLRDFAVRDSNGNDIFFNLTEHANTDRMVTTRNEFGTFDYGGIANFTSTNNLIQLNDAAWNQTDDPTIETLIPPFSPITGERYITLVMEFDSSKSISNIAFVKNEATVPLDIRIYSQDGEIPIVGSLPSSTADATWTDGTNYAYEIEI